MNTLYEDHCITVYTNGSGEIFVSPKNAKKATIRVSPAQQDLKITCAEGSLIPGSLNGLSCFIALPGKVKTS